MAIVINEKSKTISLHTNHTTYQMKIGNLDYLYHLYYGPTVEDVDLSYQILQYDRGFSGNVNDSRYSRTFSLDAQPQEYTSQQQGDFRVSSIELVNADGSYCFNGRVKSYQVYDGKYRLSTLPTAFAREEDNCQTIEIVLEDAYSKVQLVLYYSVYEEADVITRAVKLCNKGEGKVRIKKLASMCLDFVNGSNLDMVSLPGRYGQERQVERQRLNHHIHTVSSTRGSSSHQQNPTVILCDKDATEDYGSCYGVALLYSGNFLAEAELDQYDQARLVFGINTRQFDYAVNPGEEFEAPEVLMVYSAEGMTHLSHTFHDFFRNNMCESKFVKAERPVLINTWEAAFFDFDDKKLIDIAAAAKKMGVDLMVMDDGWFGKRWNDNAGLGDWKVNPERIKCGLNGLVKQINDMGMKFGIWFEPESVSEDSDLYRAHPEWVLQIPGRPPVYSRNQLILDIGREDVQQYLIKSVNDVLDSANIAYMKWDINRSVTDIFSQALPAEQQGEVYHRYVLGLYKLLDGIVKTHPDILFEGCSGGGGRFDPAMLTYFPQYWVSDNTKPLDNLKLHYGTSFIYPVSAMGAHVSESQSFVPLETKATVAMCGTFGYELDATKLKRKDIMICKEQSRQFRKYQKLIFGGDYYRLNNPFRNGNFTAWQHVSKDKKEALLSVVVTGLTVNGPQEYVKAKGLDPKKKYRIENTNLVLTGSALMNAGLPIPREVPDWTSFRFYMKAVR